MAEECLPVSSGGVSRNKGPELEPIPQGPRSACLSLQVVKVMMKPKAHAISFSRLKRSQLSTSEPPELHAPVARLHLARSDENTEGTTV